MSGLANSVANGRTTRPALLKAAVRELWDELRIARATMYSRARFRSLSRKKNLKLHLGCGVDIKQGWLNVDLRVGGVVAASLPPDTQFISHDLRLGLPLHNASCIYVYSSHCLEHLDAAHGIQLLRDVHRVLQPEGKLRLALPDFRSLFAAYLRKDEAFFKVMEAGVAVPRFANARCWADYVNYAAYQFGEHRAIYDEENLALVLAEAGFRRISSTVFDPAVDPDTPLRKAYSFYTEAMK